MFLAEVWSVFNIFMVFHAHLEGRPMFWVCFEVHRLITCQVDGHHAIIPILLTQLHHFNGPAWNEFKLPLPHILGLLTEHNVCSVQRK